jgi:hypothetical protein
MADLRKKARRRVITNFCASGLLWLVHQTASFFCTWGVLWIMGLHSLWWPVSITIAWKALRIYGEGKSIAGQTSENYA